MKTTTRRLALIVAASFALLPGCGCLAAPPHAARAVPDMPLAPPKDVRVERPWVRAAPPGAGMLAGYMVVRNAGKAPVRLVSAQSPDFGAVELHRTAVVNGISTMRPAGELTIAPGVSLNIETGGLHLMLMQPKRELKAGDSVRLRLHFGDGTALTVDAPVSAAAPATASH